MKLSSPSFTHQSSIPSRFTCDSLDISPALNWNEVPTNTKTFVLIVDDPDAPHGLWTHWVLYNIPAGTQSLEEDARTLPMGTREGINSWGKTGYGGPCPPAGNHRYFFKLYALDFVVPEMTALDSETLQKKMKGHILGMAELMGIYQRKK